MPFSLRGIDPDPGAIRARCRDLGLTADEGEQVVEGLPLFLHDAGHAPLRFEAHYDGTALIVQRVAGALPAQDQSHELWIIAPEATPVSLGLIGDTPLRVPYPEPPPGWVLAVTVEPAGGAPQGLPTGPIVASGEISL